MARGGGGRRWDEEGDEGGREGGRGARAKGWGWGGKVARWGGGRRWPSTVAKVAGEGRGGGQGDGGGGVVLCRKQSKENQCNEWRETWKGFSLASEAVVVKTSENGGGGGGHES